ncbi:hypothetical protein [Bradyrhizobium sp. 170]|uniref:hypothetical protein n=1 Tax=Bradyrhizobium sp. 170 TaxID=2782641 RepID=UPI001FFE4AD0|nr:hypothetical protein [Bradyrhizobium sp. 170]UPK05135.1 hypothetical protein IVB05_05260 [Bradyrhizobium sp. 170]
MDNKLNEIRRKIRFLRAEMLSAEDNIRKRVNRDEDCSEAAVHLMSMRVVMLGLIGERNRLGGEERLLNVDERLKLDVRAASRKSSNGAPVRFPAKAGPGVGPGWGAARVTKTRPIKKPEPRSDATGTEKARGRRER